MNTPLDAFDQGAVDYLLAARYAPALAVAAYERQTATSGSGFVWGCAAEKKRSRCVGSKLHTATNWRFIDINEVLAFRADAGGPKVETAKFAAHIPPRSKI